MESVAEGLWALADYQEKKGDVGKAIKCLEAICQTSVSFLPVTEVKTRLRIASLLLNHTHNVNHAKSHLERSHLLLKSIPSCFDLKCKAFSLLSQSYHLVGAISSQKLLLSRALDLISAASASSGDDQLQVKLWACNFYSQLASALINEADYQSSISALEHGRLCAAELCYSEMEMFFATSCLHVHLMHWEDDSAVAAAVDKCDVIWASIHSDRRQRCHGLSSYNELLHTFYCLRVCDYKNAAEHVNNLDNSMKTEQQQMQHMRELYKELDALNQSLSRSGLQPRDKLALSEKQVKLQEQIRHATLTNANGSSIQISENKLDLAPPPLNGEWLPRNAVYALLDLMVATLGRPKGLFKECCKRIESGMLIVQEELLKLGITENHKEVDLQHSAIWMAGVYLMLLMQFLENKVAVELTRSGFVEAQEALVQMRKWFTRFPTILQACESIIEMLRGQYAHYVGCYSEATYHFIEAAKLTESKSVRAMSQVYAAVSYICIGDAESSSLALDLIGPIYRTIDSYVGVREKSCILFAYGLLLMKQHDLQEARNRLAKGLQMTHANLGNLQLVAQYLTILGSLALALHDTVQSREILRSALTLAKKLYDIPSQIWVLSILTALYQELGERGNEMENAEYQIKKADELQRRIADAQSSICHIELIDKVKVEEIQFQEEAEGGMMVGESSMNLNHLDIPESIGLSTSLPNPSSKSRIVDFDSGSGRRVRRRYI